MLTFFSPTETIIASILIIGTILRFYNIGFEDLPEGQLQVKIEEQIHSVDRVTTFDQIPESGFGLIVDSSGLIEIAALRSSAAKELRTSTGDSIQIINTSNESNSSTPVSIQPKKEN